MKPTTHYFTLLHAMQEHLTRIGGNVLHHEYEAAVDEIAELIKAASSLREMAFRETRPSGVVK